ncbi:hypothetical protein SAMN04487905_1193 [Actinopolyspora xinjiangensis]|uniref:Uncharacterized protein n=1 Tax=Actinopolyspora xinjiangensis TaxID=405564 RepID=A0A1H0WZ11_9ACTN|nr:hypothetical protein [Actinopolyspora xinjiangensis]SDP95968.1 hypothetical protein SAMN04487905_1193 [Actinopolyspora xinjiangensis]
MRPRGVRQRIQQLREHAERQDQANPHLALRRGLTRFIHGCAALGYSDIPGTTLVESYREVRALLDDPGQQRTHSTLERVSLDCIDQLGKCDAFTEVAADPQRKAGRDDEIAEPVLLRIPPRTLMGRDTSDSYFPMACFNAAGTCLDGVLSPYRCCLLVTSLGYYEPAEERELLDMMRTFRIDYEDQPDNRTAIAERITHQLRDFARRFE